MRAPSQAGKIRPPAVAGAFYPASPALLRGAIDRLLAAAPDYRGPAPKAVIAPHAGYIYSGPVAAAAFVSLCGAPSTRVVVIGPAHYVAFSGIALPDAD